MRHAGHQRRAVVDERVELPVGVHYAQAIGEREVYRSQRIAVAR
ncbi:MAG: hypothetical protein RMJ33_12635 [Saprospiraceae bacterium]|nr:hypothetical protein [Saprospiraceae bacterium]MDW8230674.1 hypothetical protein [Saprospiraceae bacterium]